MSIWIALFHWKINGKWLKFKWNCATPNQSYKKKKFRVGQLRCQKSEYAAQTSFLLFVALVDGTFYNKLIVCLYVFNFWPLHFGTFNGNLQPESFQLIFIFFWQCIISFYSIISVSNWKKKYLIPIRCEPNITILLVIQILKNSNISLYSYDDVVVSFWHLYSHLSFAVFSIAG